jgi:hypothetical protein
MRGVVGSQMEVEFNVSTCASEGKNVKNVKKRGKKNVLSDFDRRGGVPKPTISRPMNTRGGGGWSEWHLMNRASGDRVYF